MKAFTLFHQITKKTSVFEATAFVINLEFEHTKFSSIWINCHPTPALGPYSLDQMTPPSKFKKINNGNWREKYLHQICAAFWIAILFTIYHTYSSSFASNSSNNCCRWRKVCSIKSTSSLSWDIDSPNLDCCKPMCCCSKWTKSWYWATKSYIVNWWKRQPHNIPAFFLVVLPFPAFLVLLVSWLMCFQQLVWV